MQKALRETGDSDERQQSSDGRVLKRLIAIAFVAGVIAAALRARSRRAGVRIASPPPIPDDVERWENEGGAVVDGESQAFVAV